MKVATDICASCGSPLHGTSSLFGALCPACVLRASCTPDPTAGDSLTTWAEVFPQLEVERVLRDGSGLTIYLARLVGSDHGGRAVLQIASGKRLQQAGGTAALGVRVQRMLTAGLDGVTPILDSGDLADAFFVVAEAPELPTLSELLVGRESIEISYLLESGARAAERVAVQARAEKLDFPFDPELCFVDEDSGRVLLVPPLLPPEGEPALSPSSPSPAGEGSVLGPFRLEKRIGEGGFGEVWRGRQRHPVERTVALKLLKSGLHSQRARARFELEQQALARLEHPHIARFIEGGVSPDGRPYFAMEWIDGSRLNRFVEESEAPLEERLRLFREVGEAVHHAHQKGILHRDLKSSNVMVAGTGSGAAAKVIDFGIARVAEDPSLDHTQLTRLEEMLGTPASMSPEQAAGAGASELDARTDIYGLGVLLYELLSGSLPFDPALPADELRRCIREVEPLRPSSRVADPELRRRLRGDLDWITMRCLEKDPARRYRSVSALLRDLERHVHDEPVDAGPPELAYRVRKFVRRNRAAVAAAFVVVVVLVLATAFSVSQAIRTANERDRALAAEALAGERLSEAERAREEAEEISAFIIDLFEQPIDEDGDRDVTVRDSLAEAVQKLRSSLGDYPLRKATLLRVIGHTYQTLGYPKDAEPLYEEAVGILRKAHGVEHADTICAMHNLANCYDLLGKDGQARELREQVFGLRKKVHDSVGHGTLLAMSSLADSYVTAGDYSRAIELFEQVLELRRKGDGPKHPETLRAMAKLAYAHASSGEPEESISIMEEVIAIHRQVSGPEHPATLGEMHELANYLHRAGRDDEALELRKQVLELQTQNRGESHEATIGARINFAVSLWESGKRAEAIGFDEETLALCRRALGTRHEDTLLTMNNLADRYLESKRIDEAIVLAQEAVDSSRGVFAETHPQRRRAVSIRVEAAESRLVNGSFQFINRELIALRELPGTHDADLALEQRQKMKSFIFRAPATCNLELIGGTMAQLAYEDGDFPRARGLGLLVLAAEAALQPAGFLMEPAATIPKEALRNLKHHPELFPEELGWIEGDPEDGLDADFYARMFEGFDPEPVFKRLRQESYFPIEPLPADWRIRVRCQTLAAHQDWEAALDAAKALEPTSGGGPELARFRWHCLRQLGRDRDAANAIRDAIPPRPADATWQQLDLTDHYMARTDEPIWVEKNRGSRHALFARLPRGLGEFAGTRFDLRGVIQMAGTRIAGRPIPYPESVEGIKVGRSATRIHFLHSPEAGEGTEAGTLIATYRVHYEDGDIAEFPIRYHPDWNRWGGGPAGGRSPDAGFEMAWRGPANAFKSTWENPRPEAPIASIDIVSAMGPLNLAVFAITLE